ncbi:Zf-CCCH domain protein [Ceratobasidium sp. AG-Ba]|nr:Zf-CCCH domain protein [Ceratobasidium sp. AG-Ba]
MDDAGDKYGHLRAYITVLEREHASKSPTDGADPPPGDNAALAAKIAALLVDDEEDGVKSLLVEKLGVSESSPDLDGYVLELMHKHKDDLEGAPLSSLNTPTKRPLSRASSTSYRLPRPETPSAGGSPLSTSFRRPHTPASVTSPLAANLQAYALGNSPSASPTMAHASVAFPGVIGGLSGSRPASPLPSPRHLNAKAVEFRPGMISRQASATSAAFHRDTPSPDVWGHGSPRGGGSSLAIAAPLVRTDSSFYPRPLTPGSSMSSSFPGPGSTPNPVPTLGASSNLSPPSGHIGASPLSNESPVPVAAVPVPTTTATANRPRHNSFDDEDEFSPFGTRPAGAQQFFSFETPAYAETEEEYYADRVGGAMGISGVGLEGYDDPQSLAPIEVLAKVFGTSVSQTDLEDALAQAGWEFDGAMALLVERARPGSKAIQVKAPQAQGPVSRSAGVSVVPRETFAQTRAVAGKGQTSTGKPSTPSVGSGANRVCRYYLAGECRRADCRFSHDVERALCRFWLRGQCMKGDQCEFLHTLPQESDVNGLVDAMGRTELVDSVQPEEPPAEDFPLLGRSGPAPKHDPGRSRFAAAAKKGAAAPSPVRAASATASTKPAAPRASPRLRLRPPSLLPTLPTGESLNAMYMSYRSRALQLGAARNACLSRAADAWRRGDGAAAKRFSKDAHELNRKMIEESGEAARRIVKERVRAAVEAAKGRDAGWSDDQRDRTERGKICGGELGVVLGVASISAAGEGGKGLSPEERMECLLDLHGLHATEGVEALQEFLIELERERYLGLAYVIVGEEKHTGTQDIARGSSKARLGAAVREWLVEWGYPWSERGGVLCVDGLTHK